MNTTRLSSPAQETSREKKKKKKKTTPLHRSAGLTHTHTHTLYGMAHGGVPSWRHEIERERRGHRPFSTTDSPTPRHSFPALRHVACADTNRERERAICACGRGARTNSMGRGRRGGVEKGKRRVSSTGKTGNAKVAKSAWRRELVGRTLRPPSHTIPNSLGSPHPSEPLLTRSPRKMAADTRKTALQCAGWGTCVRHHPFACCRIIEGRRPTSGGFQRVVWVRNPRITLPHLLPSLLHHRTALSPAALLHGRGF